MNTGLTPGQQLFLVIAALMLVYALGITIPAHLAKRRAERREQRRHHNPAVDRSSTWPRTPDVDGEHYEPTPIHHTGDLPTRP